MNFFLPFRGSSSIVLPFKFILICSTSSDSFGSSISKYNLEEIFIKTEKKSYVKKKPVESIEESQGKKEEVKEFTMDDFLDDFKL